ncbi:hypothetical protein [Halovulum sp. GXIMD14793]
MKQLALDLTPWVRVALYLISGWLAGQGANQGLVTYIGTDPEFIAAAAGLVALMWWRIAKRKGAPT